MTRATLALLRVSTEKQDAASQEASIRAYAAARGWTLEEANIIREPEGTHGDDEKRPALDDILARASRGEVARLLVTMQDRIGRRGFETARVMYLLHSFQVEVHATMDGGLVSMDEDSWGDVVVYLKAKQGRQYLTELRKKTAAGLNGWKLDGKSVPPGTPGAVRVSVRRGLKLGTPEKQLSDETRRACLARLAEMDSTDVTRLGPVEGYVLRPVRDENGNLLETRREPVTLGRTALERLLPERFEMVR